MPNHVDFIVVPRDEDGLRATFGEAHRRYTAHINARKRWTGHLWQGRFSSVAMDDAHVWAALRYVALNPVTAGLCAGGGLALVECGGMHGRARDAEHSIPE